MQKPRTALSVMEKASLRPVSGVVFRVISLGLKPGCYEPSCGHAARKWFSIPCHDMIPRPWNDLDMLCFRVWLWFPGFLVQDVLDPRLLPPKELYTLSDETIVILQAVLTVIMYYGAMVLIFVPFTDEWDWNSSGSDFVDALYFGTTSP